MKGDKLTSFVKNSTLIGIKLFLMSIVFCLIPKSYAQKSVPGTILQQINKTQDSTTLFFHTSTATPKESFKVLDLNSRVSFNSSYPRGFNDGPLWKGKGITTELHGGISGKKGKWSFQLMPVIFFSQNSEFKQAPNNRENELTYQFTRIDWVQRYGTSAKLFFHPGQSEVKFQAGKFIASLSTQNYSVGPSFFNPVLLSQQGNGFPHLRIGSSPFTIKKIGVFEANVLGGVLIESDHFDNETKNDFRLFNGLFINYQPSFLKNFKIGIGKVLYKQTRYFEAEDIIALITILEGEDREGFNAGNDTFDQMASAFAEWSFPSVGFRMYGEFAKNDFTGRFRWTAVEPEHTRGYTIGFEKIVQSKNNKEYKILYEHTNLSHNQAFLWRPTPTFYAHGVNHQGYTNDGQLIGAGIGPGGNSDHLLLQMQNMNNQVLGLTISRIENNRDYFVSNSGSQGLGLTIDDHDVEYSLGLFASRRKNNYSIFGEATYSYNFNRYYQNDRSNIYLLTGISFHF